MTPPQAARAGHLLANGWGKKDVAVMCGITIQELRDWIRSERGHRRILAAAAQAAWKKAKTDREKEIVWANYGDVLA